MLRVCPKTRARAWRAPDAACRGVLGPRLGAARPSTEAGETLAFGSRPRFGQRPCGTWSCTHHSRTRVFGQTLRTTAATALATALLSAATGCGSPAATSTSFDGAAYPPGIRAPDFVLPDLDGRTISLSAQRGHVVALAFLPGDCRTCLLVAQQIRGALDELESRPHSSASVRTILISTSPRTDNRARARSFLARTALLGRVSYLLAGEEEMRPVWRAYHVTPPGASGQTAIEDAIAVLLIDPRGYERVGFGIEQITPDALSHDIRLLQAG